MTDAEIAALRPGDLVIHRMTRWHTYVVTAVIGGHVIATRTIGMFNPREWDRVPAEPAP